MKDYLNTIIKIAVDAHAGQIDKAGQPYILHPLAVMLDPELTTTAERAAAVGHDLFEDTAVTEDDLRDAGIPEIVIEAIWSVTQGAKESYDSFLDRSCSHPIGIKVKRADVRHNCSDQRIGGIPDRFTRKRLKAKYDRAKKRLGMT